ncbi:MAG: T9SS type A sorting domain-containing protein [Bacteroidia bacterium]
MNTGPRMVCAVLMSFLLIDTPSPLNAQNFVTNGDFDTYSTAPNNYAQVCYATGWKSPNNLCTLNPGNGSPDYYNTNGSGGAKPPATWWANVSPHSGTGLDGFACYYSSANYREYIQRPLSGPLTPGVTYQVSFWLTNGVSTLHYWGIKEVGLYFSVGAVAQTAGAPILVTPQVELTSVFYSTAWTQFTFSFTPTAAYDWVTMGNFRNDAATTKALFGPALTSSYGAYYYVDDISVMVATPLPVTWLDFTGNFNEEAGVKLHWSTACEKNSDYFEVQRSADGVTFSSIGRVGASGTTCEVSGYEFTDPMFNSGVVYYQIRETDLDATTDDSKIIAVETGSRRNVIYPQPAKDQLYLSGNWSGKSIAKIVDISGRVLIETTAGNLMTGLDVSMLPAGMYVLCISDEQDKPVALRFSVE